MTKIFSIKIKLITLSRPITITILILIEIKNKLISQIKKNLFGIRSQTKIKNKSSQYKTA